MLEDEYEQTMEGGVEESKIQEGDIISLEPSRPKLKEGMIVINNLGDIDQVLSKIKRKDDDATENLTETQIQVLSCLGLL